MTKTTTEFDRLSQPSTPYFKLLADSAKQRGDSYEAMLEVLALPPDARAH